ncbi:hypothetical protein QQP08_000232, partial [Theobroma cacao]
FAAGVCSIVRISLEFNIGCWSEYCSLPSHPRIGKRFKIILIPQASPPAKSLYFFPHSTFLLLDKSRLWASYFQTCPLLLQKIFSKAKIE